MLIKRLIAICMIFILLAFTACSPAAIPGDHQAGATSWAIENNLHRGDETAEELYELAKQEGSVVWYSASSRSAQVAESFMAQYPGVTVEVYNISTNELLEKIMREYEAGIRNADLIHVKDQGGTLWNEMVLQGKFHNYYPYDIIESIDPRYMDTIMPMYIELNQWFYNTEVYPDGPPITSWWDFTKPEWKGRIMLKNPLDNLNNLAFFTTMVKYADEIAADYERVFGHPIDLGGSETAAHEFLRRFASNDLIYISSSDEIVQSVGTKGQQNPPIGFASSSKLRQRDERDYAIEVIYDMTPSVGLPEINALYIVNECPNPNAAKLLLRWIMGEADGQGAGFEPFNTFGGWPVRDNVSPPEGSVQLSNIPLWTEDAEFVYDNIHKIADFWLSIQ